MSLTRLNNNLTSLTNRNNLNERTDALRSSLEKLSSGLAINRASDNAALLSISENLRSQISGLNQSIENAASGVNLANTAEGALGETSAQLQRIRDLTLQAGNGALDETALQAIQDEIDTAVAEIDRIGGDTQFATQSLLDGGGDGGSQSFSFQVGANVDQNVELELGDVRGEALGLTGIDVTSAEGRANALDAVDAAVGQVNEQRSRIGAFSNGLESSISNLGVAAENLTASESRIRDTDVASETARLIRDRFLLEAGISTQVQSNLSQAGVLSLLG
ncbi:MAG: flagellin [Candidatus Omnitrophica bacterium]|nr:flagellin [Candidatus Omnitrophota bacterium]